MPPGRMLEQWSLVLNWNWLEDVFKWGVALEVLGGRDLSLRRDQKKCSWKLWSKTHIRCCTGHIPKPKIVLYKDSASLFSKNWEVSPFGCAGHCLILVSVNPLLAIKCYFVRIGCGTLVHLQFNLLFRLFWRDTVCLKCFQVFPLRQQICFLAFAQRSPTDRLTNPWKLRIVSEFPLLVPKVEAHTLDKKLN